MENDILFLSRNGVYVLGNEPNIIGDILRTNELTAKIRPTIDTINDKHIDKAMAIYWKFKYIISYPSSGQSKNTKMIVYDRERLSWAGPWNIGGQGFELYYDTDNNEVLLYGDTDDEFVTELSESFRDDKAAAIPTFLRTKKEDFKDWSLFKTIQDIFFNFRNVLGSSASVVPIFWASFVSSCSLANVPSKAARIVFVSFNFAVKISKIRLLTVSAMNCPSKCW
ncbi:MAG: hypothetical protein IIB44_12270 [Candidatus Marinimicrobia bacterium]|nr:hypothetical protein [Candidatus Neomarinimicrobiota bacterium]